MKKYIFTAGILLAFFAITFHSPATIIENNDYGITIVDDTTKVAKESGSDKQLESKKEGCHPSKCASKCGKSSMQKSEKSKDCPEKKETKAHSGCPDKK